MSLIWLTISAIGIIVAAITLVDLFRHPRGGWATVGWVVIVVILPIVGSIIYWSTRRYSAEEAEAAYRAESDQRSASPSRFYDA